MGNTGAVEALQNSEQSLSAPVGYAASRRQLLSPLSCHPFFYLFPPDFSLSLYCSSCHCPPPPLSFCHSDTSCIPVFLSLFAPPHSPTSLTTALHLPLTNPTQDAVSAALADLDVMKLQVCQCCVCVYRSEEIYAHNK